MERGGGASLLPAENYDRLEGCVHHGHWWSVVVEDRMGPMEHGVQGRQYAQGGKAAEE